MLTVSLGAMSYLGDLLREVEAPEDVAIRFVLQQRERRFAVRLDHRQEDDAEWKQGERTILLLGQRDRKLLVHQHLQLVLCGQDSKQLEFVSQRSLKSAAC